MSADWIKCRDRFPRTGDWALVVANGFVQRQAAWFDGDEWNWADQDADPAPKEAITDWQYLPEAPK